MKHMTPVGCLVAITLWLCAWTGGASAEQVHTSWQSLPEETIFAVRLPDVPGVIHALRERTKFGQVVLSEKRLDGFLDLLKEEGAEAWAEMVDQLAAIGLKPDDLPALSKGAVGFAVVAEGRPGRVPLFVGLGWFEPGEELADRLLEALDSALEDQDDGVFPARRVDFELAGRDVIHLMIPVVEHALQEQNFWEEQPDDWDQLSPEEQQRWWQRQRQEQLENAPSEVRDQLNVLIARFGGRIVLGLTFPQGHAAVREEGGGGAEAIDFEKLTGVEQAKSIFARFLKSHGGARGGFEDSLMATPGVAEVLPPRGQVVMEMAGSLDSLVPLLEVGGQAEVLQVVKMLGLNQVGAMVMRMTLDGNQFHTGMFLEASEPRRGVLRLLDQKELVPQPAAWVPANAIGYGHASFDFGGAYRQIRQMFIEQFPQAEDDFRQAEAGLMNAIGVELAQIFDSLGHQFVMLEFEPKIVDENQMVQLAMLGDFAFRRMAIVAQVDDDQVWQKMLQMLRERVAQMGPMLPLPIQLIDDEQGFTGIRSNEAVPIRVGAFLGRGHLVIAIGEGVDDQVLSALRKKPDGEMALRGSVVMDLARRLLDARPGLVYQVMDNDRYVKGLVQILGNLFEGLMGVGRAGMVQDWGQMEVEDRNFADEMNDLAERDKRILERIKAVIPTEDEMKNVLGVSVGQVYMTRHGMVVEGVQELGRAE